MVDSRFYKNNGPITLAEVAKICNAELVDVSKSDVIIKDLATLTNAKEGDICFFFDKKKKALGAEIKATACITTSDLAEFVNPKVIKLISSDPHKGFVNLNYALYTEILPTAEIKSTAIIPASVQIGENCFVGDYAVIGENVKIGANCIIEPHAVIGHDCVIGDNCRIGSGANIMHCLMGNNCYIYGGARIGWDGFGFTMINGAHKRIPQLGRVIIGNDVEVGANSCIDRGALDDTVISDGCRIDDLVMIAHNNQLGRGCIMVSQTGIAGSCKFGDYVVCGGQVGVADHLNIGSGAQIGAQSGIMRDVDAGATLMGYPAVPIKDFMRQVSYIQKAVKK